MHATVKTLSSIVHHRTQPPVTDWFGAALDAEASRLRLNFAKANRMLGPASLGLTPVERGALERLGPLAWDAWTLCDVGRAALVVQQVVGHPQAAVATVDGLFRRGELGEQVSVLRMLPVLPQPKRFVEIAVEACRTNTQTVFCAIACDSGYAAEHFSEAAFNQMVLKSLFIEVAVERILGLHARVTPTLVRMVRDYASERRAAGRSVPTDIETIEQMFEGKS